MLKARQCLLSAQEGSIHNERRYNNSNRSQFRSESNNNGPRTWSTKIGKINKKKLKQNNKLSNLIPTGEFPPPHLSHKVMQQNR